MKDMLKEWDMLLLYLEGCNQLHIMRNIYK